MELKIGQARDTSLLLNFPSRSQLRVPSLLVCLPENYCCLRYLTGFGIVIIVIVTESYFLLLLLILVVCFGLLWSLVVKLTLVEGIVVLIAARVVTTIWIIGETYNVLCTIV